ncbi:MAG: NAD(+)/NADH kinase [Clostridia bacterium]|nr:NAD(+)/NADH kinase [Clostridia bacterium]
MIKKVSLYPNPKRDGDLSGARLVAERLLECGACVLVACEYEKAFGPAPAGLSFVEEDALFYESDCLVTLGGDGTILSVARKAADAGIPIFGINLGHVGFLAALEASELEQVDRLVAGDYTVSSRMLLSCSINGKEELLALNECVIAPERGFHIVELTLDADGRHVCDFRADGLIFNTPTGSTGYAFSAGGAVIDSEFDCIGVKAISSYMLINAHHMIFRPETEFTVKKSRSAGSRVTVCADGREERSLKLGDTVRICRSEKRVKLIFLKNESNLEVFFRKF